MDSHLAKSSARADGLDPRRTLGSFIPHDGNELAIQCATHWVNDSNAEPNCLLIVGRQSSGKSHLLHAIGNLAEARGQQVRLLRAAEFVDEVVHHYQRKSFDALNAKFKVLDLLLLDDLPDLSGKERSQEVLLELMAALQVRGARLMISSAQSVANLSGLQRRLRGQLLMAAALPIRPVQASGLNDLMQGVTQNLGGPLTPEVQALLVDRIGNDLQSLMGALNSLTLAARATGQPVDVNLTRTVLAAQIEPLDGGPPRPCCCATGRGQEH